MTTATRAPLVHSYLYLRRAIGLIGLALPVVLIAGKQLVQGGDLIGSLSGYYYSALGNVFVGAMCAAACSCSPTTATTSSTTWRARWPASARSAWRCSRTTPDRDVSSWDRTSGVLHLAFAAVFFLMLAYFCLRLFPHDGEQPPGTGVVYRACGVVILACLVLIALTSSLRPGAAAAPGAVAGERRGLGVRRRLAAQGADADAQLSVP